MAEIKSTEIVQKWARNGGFGSFGSGAVYAGYATASGGSNYVTCVRIRMPGDGVSAQLRIGYSHDAGADTAKKMRWKITRTLQDSTYQNAGASTAADGNLSLVSGSGYFTVKYEGSFREGEYLYLYLWTGSPEGVYTLVTVSAVGNHVCTYTAGTASSLRVTGQYLGSPVAISINRNNSSFTHELWYSFAGHTGLIASGVETGYTWNPSVEVFAPYIPDTVSAVCTVTCVTMHGVNQIGSAVSAEVMLSLPGEYVPMPEEGWIVSVTAENAGTAAENISGFVQGYSRVKVIFDGTKIRNAYGAATADLEIESMGTTFAAQGTTAVTVPVTAAGEIPVRCICRDSRGRTAAETVTVSVMEYVRPSLSGVRLVRSDGNGVADENGMWILAQAETAFSSLGGQNICSLAGYWKTGSGEYDGGTEMESGVPVLLGGTLSAEVTYTARITAADSLGNSVSTEAVIPTAQCAFHIRDGGRGAAFFGYSQRDGEVTVNGDVRFTGGLFAGERAFLELVYPVGTLYFSAAEAEPGVLFGFGTWERIRDRFLLAAGEIYEAGSTGGEESHVLTAEEMPEHSHRILFQSGKLAAGSDYSRVGGTYQSGVVESTGGGQAHNNMPPYAAVYVWKRTA